jgi:hypothetical protein
MMFRILVIIMLPMIAFASETFECTAVDATHHAWQGSDFYKKSAINQALSLCKKGSPSPKTCQVTAESCELFINGESTRPIYQCTALDSAGTPFVSQAYPKRDDAALGALGFCKNNSPMAESCYINMLTCQNLNPVKRP